MATKGQKQFGDIILNEVLVMKELRETGLIVNHKAILRIMNKYGLHSEIRRRKRYKKMNI